MSIKIYSSHHHTKVWHTRAGRKPPPSEATERGQRTVALGAKRALAAATQLEQVEAFSRILTRVNPLRSQDASTILRTGFRCV